MTLLVSIVLGLSAGYLAGMHRKAFLITACGFLAALIFQSFLMPLTPLPNNIDIHDAGYWLVQPLILAFGLGLTWGGAQLKSRRSRSLTAS